ncbi:molybdenum ABC transporter substrate-binding protein [Bordetella genomosp. 10]|uniref:Molybdenum ABC transporter substrate-binding protein n=1 Tax=Bordetella genomosp. 10 TaxID=1416804 RepID=A0A261SJK7_9BORD|nr:substrate-binding domain-containing protein [Bordetella genomosp. 10]OZI37619.1 molybdenum ABC transporter substrate-binding protein [Bordetella genomosp. 10]
MKPYPRLLSTKVAGLLGATLAAAAFASAVHAAEVSVVTSGGFTAAYKILGPQWAKSSGNTLKTQLGPSMGKSDEAIPNRLARGEKIDVVIMVGYALDDLIKQGKVIPGSRVDLADSRIGMVVRQGQPKPNISTMAAFKKTLLAAQSVAYSDSASGVYIENEMYKKMGIEDQLKPKSTRVQKTPVAELVAEGKYQLGFQQVAELLPVKGVTFVGRIPEEAQSVTRFAAGIPVDAEHPKEAAALLKYLASSQVQPTVRKTGLDSVKKPAAKPAAAAQGH